MKYTDRRLDLSSKFMQMGQSLILEGKKESDLALSQVGTIFIFMSGLMLGDDDDIFKFSDLCSMFSAKKVLDSLQDDGNIMKSFMNEVNDSSTYEDFINRINNIRNKNKKGKDDNKN